MMMNNKHYMEFDSTSNYMRYQRERIRELESWRRGLVIGLMIMTIALLFVCVKFTNLQLDYIDSQDNVKSLQQMIKEKNEYLS